MITSISHAKKLHMRVFDRSSVFLTLFALLGICASRAIHVCKSSNSWLEIIIDLPLGFPINTIISQQFMFVERGEDRVAFFKCLRKLALIRTLLRKMSCNEKPDMSFRHLQVELSFFPDLFFLSLSDWWSNYLTLEAHSLSTGAYGCLYQNTCILIWGGYNE